MSVSVAFLAVIDRLIALLKRREEVNRSTFDDVLSPAMASIEEVHKDYLASFSRYRQGLKDKGIPLNSSHPLFDSIKEDNIFSEQLRSKVTVLEPLLKDKDFGEFLSAIHTYLFNAAEPPLTQRTFPEKQPLDDKPSAANSRPSQAIRTGYERGLSKIVSGNQGNDGYRRERAITALDDAVTTLQNHYHQVLVAYTALQKKLLSPK